MAVWRGPWIRFTLQESCSQTAPGATVDGKKISLKSWDAIKHELKRQGKTDALRELESALKQDQKIRALKLARAHGLLLEP